MKNNSTVKRISFWAMVVLLILMVPFFGQFPWTLSDFLFAGFVLFGAASFYEITTRNIKSRKYKILVAIAVVGFLVLVQAWAAAGPD